MCTVSMLMDYGRDRIPLQQWTPNTWYDFQEILRRLDALDKKLEQPECHDPAKAEWMKDVEERLAKLEAAAAPPAVTTGTVTVKDLDEIKILGCRPAPVKRRSKNSKRTRGKAR